MQKCWMSLQNFTYLSIVVLSRVKMSTFH